VFQGEEARERRAGEREKSVGSILKRKTAFKLSRRWKRVWSMGDQSQRGKSGEKNSEEKTVIGIFTTIRVA